MVTATEDHSDRLSALEAGVTELRADLRVHAATTTTRLTNLETAVSAMRTEMQAMRTDHQADIRALNAQIHRIQWSIIGFGSALVITMLGMIITLIFKL